MWIFGIFFLAWSLVTFIVLMIWNKKRLKLARKYGGYRKFAWVAAAGYVRIDWDSKEIPEGFVIEYKRTMPIYSIIATASSLIWAEIFFLFLLFEG